MIFYFQKKIIKQRKRQRKKNVRIENKESIKMNNMWFDKEV